MIALVRAELLKVWTTRLWIALLLIGAALAAAGAILLLAIAGTTQNGTVVPDVTTAADVRSLIHGSADLLVTLVLVLGATISTSEYRYGTAAITYLTEPRRARVVTAKVLAAIPIGIVFGIVGGVVPLLAAFVWFAASGDRLPFDASVLAAVGEVAVQATFAATFGVAVGAIFRGQLAAIVTLLVYQLIAEPLVGVLLPSVVPWLPFTGLGGSFGVAADQDVFSRPAAAVLMVAYVGALWATAIWLERRRDV